MATYLDRAQIRHRRQIQQRYDADMRRLALLIALLLGQYSRTGTLPTDVRTRLALKAAIWAQVLGPYFIGNGEPFQADLPQSAYARLLHDGLEGAVRIQVQRQQALFKRTVKDEAMRALVFAPSVPVTLPATQQASYQQPFYAYVDQNGYKLNDRIMRNAIDVRTRVDRMLDYHMATGDTTATTSAALDNFMTISGRSTRQPYGEYGSYAGWRGLRGEMLMATGRATVLASALNPVVEGIQWRLSPTHRDTDECDANAAGGPNGDGIYPVGSVPPYPNHPNDRCALWPVAGQATGDAPRGVLNDETLTRALLTQPAGERQAA